MQQASVTIYSSPTCAYCHMAKEYFTDKNIEFTEKDISSDQQALKFVLEEVGQAVTPIITINDHVIIGFDRPKIDEALEQTHQDGQRPAAN
jgi:glutaredoxin-like YruB-family protein